MNEWIAKVFPQWNSLTSFWSTLEFGREAQLGWITAFIVLFLIASWLYRQDTRTLHPFWKVWLWSLRIATLATLLVVALVPQERKSRSISQPSRVVILADTSVSMSRQDKDLAAAGGATAERAVPSRADLVQTLLEKSPLLETLRKTHDVSIMTFDSQLVRQQVLRKAAAPQSPGTAEANDGRQGSGRRSRPARGECASQAPRLGRDSAPPRGRNASGRSAPYADPRRRGRNPLGGRVHYRRRKQRRRRSAVGL